MSEKYDFGTPPLCDDTLPADDQGFNHPGIKIMGIESGLIAAGVSSGTAATVSAVATGVLTAAAGAVVTSALAPKQPKADPQIPAINQSDKPPQATRAPDLTLITKKNSLAASAAGSLGGNNSTLLTGSQGVNPGSLNLGRSTLLGQ